MTQDNQPNITQTVTGDHNIFSATGDIYHTVYQLSPAEGQDRANLLILLNKVRQFWVRGVLEQSVHHAVLLELGKETRPQEVEHPWDMDLEVPGRDKPQRLAPGTKISGVFEQTGRLLLILGEPGSGKTITLLELARDLLNQAEHDPTQPIPVVFNLSSWAEKRAPLKDWLVEELKSKYLIPKKIARDWLDNLRILPLLDGLDEVKTEHRAACLDAINTFAEEGIPGMAVCSRLQEYLALPRRLKLNGAICLQALTQVQIDEYLANAGEGLEALHKLLREDEGLRELSQTPLMLNIMVMAYHGMPVDEVQAQKVESLDARRRQLFDLYVGKMFKRKGKKSPPYPQEKSIEWISWLAHKMTQHGKTIFLIEELQPSWLDKKQQIIYFILSRVFPVSLVFLCITIFIAGYNINIEFLVVLIGWGAFSGALIGITDFYFNSKSPLIKFFIYLISCFIFTFLFFYLLSIIMYTTTGDDEYAITEKSLSGFGFIGIGLGFLVSLFFYLRVKIRSVLYDVITVEKMTWSIKKSIKGFMSGFFVGFILVFLVNIVSYFFGGDYKFSISRGILWGVIYGFIGLSISGFVKITTKESRSFNQGITRTAKNILYIGIICMAISGGLFYWFDKFFGIVLGLTMSIVAMLAYGATDIFQHYLIRIILKKYYSIPFRLYNLLYYYSNIMLLKELPGSYIFIHRYLLEHFATLYEESQNKQVKK